MTHPANFHPNAQYKMSLTYTNWFYQFCTSSNINKPVLAKPVLKSPRPPLAGIKAPHQQAGSLSSICCNPTDSISLYLMASRKRTIQEVNRFDTLQEPVSNASVHGTITTLSPVKKGKHSVYFEGTITDGSTNLRLVGFSSDQQKKLASFRDQHKPTHLQNCEVKQSRFGDKLEILLKRFTAIVDSPRDIAMSEAVEPPPVSTSIHLDDLPTTQEFQKITVDVKVVVVNEPVTVTGGKTKQDLVVADSTSTARLTLWEEKVHSMDLDQSYTLTNVVVRKYQDKKYLSFPRNGSSVDAIDDIGHVIEYDPEDDDEQSRELRKPVVVAVQLFDTYKSCLICKARVECTSPPLGRCTKCSMLQRIDHCGEQVSAKLILQEANSPTTKTLSGFGSLLQQLARGEVTAETLLNCPPLTTLTYNKNGVITGVQRNQGLDH